MDHHHEHFHRSDESARRGRFDCAFAVPPCDAEYDADEDQAVQQQREHRLRDRQVERAHLLSVDAFDDLAGVRAVLRDVIAVIFPMFQARR